MGWTYDRALFLSLLDDESALAEAIEIARGLGARPLRGRVARRMRELGHPVPRGPAESTRANPLGLTARQLEVLRLVADGLTNAEIADRLIVPPRRPSTMSRRCSPSSMSTPGRAPARRAVEFGILPDN